MCRMKALANGSWRMSNGSFRNSSGDLLRFQYSKFTAFLQEFMERLTGFLISNVRH